MCCVAGFESFLVFLSFFEPESPSSSDSKRYPLGLAIVHNKFWDILDLFDRFQTTPPCSGAKGGAFFFKLYNVTLHSNLKIKLEYLVYVHNSQNKKLFDGTTFFKKKFSAVWIKIPFLKQLWKIQIFKFLIQRCITEVLGVFLLPREISDKIWGLRHLIENFGVFWIVKKFFPKISVFHFVNLKSTEKVQNVLKRDENGFRVNPPKWFGF